MKITLHPIPQSKIGILQKIITDRIIESHLEHRSSVGEVMVKLERGYNERRMGAYVDDLNNPQCALIMSLFHGSATEDRYANIALAYVVPELRGKAEYGNALIETAEAYAKHHKANSLLGTSWLYKDSKDTGWFWKAKGFEPQETIYVKHLT